MKKSPRMQKQCHPLSIPTGAFKGQLRRTLVSTTLPVQMRHSHVWRIIHTFTHTHTGYARFHVNPPRLHLIFADLYVEGLTEVSTQSPDAQTQRIGSPLS